MNVYIITKEPFPNGMAATNRIKCYAKALKEHGVCCKILIFMRTGTIDSYSRNKIGESVWENIPYQYIGGTSYRHSNLFVRKWNDILDRIRLIIYLRKNLCAGDVVLGYCGPYVHYINILINVIHKKHAKYVRDLCELPYGTSSETKMTIKNRKVVLEKQFPKCDGIIAISESLLNLANKYKSSQTKTIKIPIMVDFCKFDMEDRSNESEVPYIFHSGTLFEQKDGILGMFEAFGMVTQKYKKPLNFILTGQMEKSPHMEQIKTIIHKYHLEDRIHFLGYLNDEKLRDYLSKASLVIINKNITQQNKYCFSTKLAEYLAAEKVVIITNVGEAAFWLKNKDSAYIVEPENAEKLSESIIYALKNSKLSKKKEKKGKELCRESVNNKCYGKVLSDFLRTC